MTRVRWRRVLLSWLHCEKSNTDEGTTRCSTDEGSQVDCQVGHLVWPGILIVPLLRMAHIKRQLSRCRYTRSPLADTSPRRLVSPSNRVLGKRRKRSGRQINLAWYIPSHEGWWAKHQAMSVGGGEGRRGSRDAFHTPINERHLMRECADDYPLARSGIGGYIRSNPVCSFSSGYSGVPLDGLSSAAYACWPNNTDICITRRHCFAVVYYSALRVYFLYNSRHILAMEVKSVAVALHCYPLLYLCCSMAYC